MILPLDSELEPVIDGAVFDAILKDKQWQRDEILRCSEEPWYFIVNYCWTKKPVGLTTIIDRVPPKEYLRLMANDWVLHPKYAISKSRQLMATWLIVILNLWLAMFNRNINVCFQTKKEEDADTEMCKRADFVWAGLPIWMRKAFPQTYSHCKNIFPKTKSLISGIPSGGPQIRSHNPNSLLLDEIAFQDEAEESYAASLACCQRITLVTSPNPGWADDFYHDRIKVA